MNVKDTSCCTCSKTGFGKFGGGGGGEGGRRVMSKPACLYNLNRATTHLHIWNYNNLNFPGGLSLAPQLPCYHIRAHEWHASDCSYFLKKSKMAGSGYRQNYMLICKVARREKAGRYPAARNSAGQEGKGVICSLRYDPVTPCYTFHSPIFSSYSPSSALILTSTKKKWRSQKGKWHAYAEIYIVCSSWIHPPGEKTQEDEDGEWGENNSCMHMTYGCNSGFTVDVPAASSRPLCPSLQQVVRFLPSQMFEWLSLSKCQWSEMTPWKIKMMTYLGRKTDSRDIMLKSFNIKF